VRCIAVARIPAHNAQCNEEYPAREARFPRVHGSCCFIL
jgi:hypothetical protein